MANLGVPFARFVNDNPAHDLRLRPDAKEITMTLTATRETGTVRPTSSPTLRFLGGVGIMLLASTVGAWILALLRPGPPPSGEDAILTGIMGSIAGNVLGLAGLAWFSIRRSDWMPIMGGFTALPLEYLILSLDGII